MANNVTQFPMGRNDIPPAARKLSTVREFGTNSGGDKLALCRCTDLRTGSTQLEIVLFARDGVSDPWQTLAVYPDNDDGKWISEVICAVAAKLMEHVDLNAEEMEAEPC